jgi:hypothetical protein
MPNGEKSTISKCRTILNEQLNRKTLITITCTSIYNIGRAAQAAY